MKRKRPQGEVIKIEDHMLTEFELAQLNIVAAAARIGYNLGKTTPMSEQDVGIYVRKAWMESIISIRKKQGQ